MFPGLESQTGYNAQERGSLSEPSDFHFFWGLSSSLGERLPCKQEVAGSWPAGSTGVVLSNLLGDIPRCFCESIIASASVGFNYKLLEGILFLKGSSSILPILDFSLVL